MQLEEMINKVHCADCLEFMKQIPDKSVDLVLTDPPYGIGIDKAMHNASGTQYGKSAAKKKDYGKTDWDVKPSSEYFKEILRISNSQVIFGGNYFTDFLPPSRKWYIWDKKTDDKYSNDFADAELAWCSIDGNTRIIRYLWHGMIQQNMKEKETRQHPTQKPIQVIEKILLECSESGGVVLDPFLGSGTTAVACKNLGRKFIGIEISSEYCKIAEDRLRQEVLF